MHRIHHKIILWSKPNKDGLRTVMLRVTYLRQPRYFSLGRYCSEGQWDADAGRFRANHPNNRAENALLLTIEGRAAKIVYGYERDNLPFDWAAFEAEMFAQGERAREKTEAERREKTSLEEYLPTFLAWAKTSGGKKGDGSALNTWLSYETAAHNFSKYRPGLPMSEATEETLAGFERWLRKAGAAEGSMKLYVARLKTIFKRAHRDGVVKTKALEDYGLRHLSDKSHKKALPVEDIQKMEAAELDTKDAFWRDLFLLSYHLRGMNMADLADLATDGVRGDRVEYGRRKTGRFFSIKINAKAKAILERYNTGAALVLPILKEQHRTEGQRRNRLIAVNTEANKALRRIAKEIGLSEQGDRLSFYSARHSYATHHENSGTNIRVIQKLLGHSDIRTTERYLKEHTDPELDRADEGMLGG